MNRRDKPERKKAVALSYDRANDNAPRVAAKGAGFIAEKILELARLHNIPIREDRDLVETLAALDLNQEVPAHLYHVIAEVLAWVYKMNSQYGK
ncbi:MAG: EscU/YscU/HrcU family type III secretion system export apparatus switch protein [Nitrospinae bacterium]|nr:EscU/YscU/HrcU family type III secretion system export apparatus switch protein [Nitrospinota bacterium]